MLYSSSVKMIDTSKFKGTQEEKLIRKLLKVYGELEKKSSSFMSDYAVHCPQGCGTCCTFFLPDITETQALVTAAFILYSSPRTEELESRLASWRDHTTGPCPLYDNDNPHHCTVYEGRPLICRLFGACTNADKQGHPVFRKCKFNPTDSMPVKLDEGDFKGERPPEMLDYGMQIVSLEANDETTMLPEAILSAMSKLRLIVALMNPGSDDDDDPNPEPIAS
jgi:Fe-S-cluster containining protein